MNDSYQFSFAQKTVKLVWIPEDNQSFFSILESIYNKISSSSNKEMAIYLCDPNEQIRKTAYFIMKKRS